jgi:hypothetical protein
LTEYTAEESRLNARTVQTVARTMDGIRSVSPDEIRAGILNTIAGRMKMFFTQSAGRINLR